MAKLVFSKQGDKLVRKYRCTSGKRKGRVVSSPQQCFAPIDIKKKQTMKRVQRTKGKMMGIKRKRTMRVDPISKQVSRLNKIMDGE